MNTPLGEVSFQAISMGNPHAVLFVDDVDQAEVAAIGSFIEKHQMFPEGVNVGFAQIINRQQIKLRVWERGVGETLACGTGACAAAVAAMRAQHCDNEITVSLIGGDLKINWNETSHVRMTGPTAVVYDGVIEVGSVNE